MVRNMCCAMALLWSGAVSAECSGVLESNQKRIGDSAPQQLCNEYAGKVLLVVNVASRCGFTPQYEGLEALHQQFKERGFSVLGFPSNDFGNQEPGSEQEIVQFCRLNYGVSFPMFEKLHAARSLAGPFYHALAAEAGEYPGWNFHKYLIDRNGKVIGSFPSAVKPLDSALVDAVTNAL